MTMENTQNNAATEKLTDSELGAVAGGFSKFEDTTTGKCYKFTGSDTNAKYLCPNCGRPVHRGDLGKFYCDPCDDSWFWEDDLLPNLKSGVWKEISKDEFEGGSYIPGFPAF